MLIWGRARWLSRRPLPAKVATTLERLERAGYPAYLVGGCLRDWLLGRPIHDYDLVTAATPEQILGLFEGAVYLAHGTVLVAGLEVTTLKGPTIEADLGLRDFTINALALRQGRLLDPFGGVADLRRRVLRSPGSAVARLSEDPLRLLRACRFAAAFGLELEPALRSALIELAPRLAQVAPERLGAELAKTLTLPEPGVALALWQELGLLEQFWPELAAGVGFEQNEYHAYDVWQHNALACCHAPPELPLRLAALLHDVGKPYTLTVGSDGRRHFYKHEVIGAELAAKMLRRVRMPRQLSRHVVHLIRHHMDLHIDLAMSDRALRRLIRRVGPENLPDLVELRRADRLANGKKAGPLGEANQYLLDQIKRVLAADSALSLADLAIDGHQVQAILGLPPGPEVGKALNWLLEQVIDAPEFNTYEQLVLLLKERYSHDPRMVALDPPREASPAVSPGPDHDSGGLA